MKPSRFVGILLILKVKAGNHYNFEDIKEIGKIVI